jgi:DUF4097 and DUF4098 domain-containing protein YvlB
MKEERMMILSMLQDGKINSEEAVKLLEALEETDEGSFINEEKAKEKADEIGEIAKEQGKKIEDMGIDIGNKIAKAFSDINFGGFSGRTESINTTVEIDISHIDNPIIDIEAINGGIILENWGEDYISIEINCKYKKGLIQENEDFFDFYELDNKIVFSPKFSGNLSINLKVFLPDKPYEDIHLKSSNGQLKINDFTGNTFNLNTSNAAITMESIEGDEVFINTKNGRIILDDIIAPKIDANTSNSNILAEDIETENINLITKNGKVILDDIIAEEIIAKTSNSSIEVEDAESKKIELITSNAKVQLNDLDLDKLNYLKIATSNGGIDIELDKLYKEIYLDLETSIGNIDLELPSLVYELNKQANLGKKSIIAHSVNYKEDENSLKLLATTSNSSIKIY